MQQSVQQNELIHKLHFNDYDKGINLRFLLHIIKKKRNDYTFLKHLTIVCWLHQMEKAKLTVRAAVEV